MKPDPNHSVTLIFTTIERHSAVVRLIASVRKYYPDLPILVAEQNRPTVELKSFYKKNGVNVVWVPYDCGLSYARNRAVESILTPFFLIGDDDFVFNEKTDISGALSIISSSSKLGIVGGSIIDVYRWEDGREQRRLRRFEKFIVLLEQWRTLVTIPIDYLAPQTLRVEDKTVYRCDMTLNWAIVRKDLFAQGVVWDESIKINGEHEDFFLTLKAHGNWEVAYYPGLQCEHFQESSPSYEALRGRTEGREAFASKWNLGHHLELGVGLREFRNYHKLDEMKFKKSDFFLWEGLGAWDDGHSPPMNNSYLRVWHDGHATAYEGPSNFLAAKIAQSDQKLREKEKSITNREEKIGYMERKVGELATQLEAMRNSFSWRITKPLRILRSIALKTARAITQTRTRN